MFRTAHFHVGNGDMTLIRLPSGRTLLVDINIRGAADEPTDPAPDVAAQLRERLERDPDGRPFVDAMLLTHPDEDHCRGLAKHFHLGPREAVVGNEKIVIREMWSSPIVFRRAKRRDKPLSPDALAWGREARRRARAFSPGRRPAEGDRILILGHDEDRSKTADREPIVVSPGERIETIGGVRDPAFSARLLGPLPVAAHEDEEELLSKNNSSVIVQVALGGSEGSAATPSHYLFGGDAEVAIWERIRARYARDEDWLRYDVLIAPHHCSWRSLSRDSWSEHPDPQVSPDARWSLSRTEGGAMVIASSVAIDPDKSDPPCDGARQEYERIVAEATPPGQFLCLGAERGHGPYELEITTEGPRPVRRGAIAASAIAAPGGLGRQPTGHG